MTSADLKMAVVGVTVYFATQAVMNLVDGQEVTSNLDSVVLNCLPRATNEQTLMSLSQQAAMRLNCNAAKNNRTVGYGQAVKPAVKFVVAVRD